MKKNFGEVVEGVRSKNASIKMYESGKGNYTVVEKNIF